MGQLVAVDKGTGGSQREGADEHVADKIIGSIIGVDGLGDFGIESAALRPGAVLEDDFKVDAEVFLNHLILLEDGVADDVTGQGVHIELIGRGRVGEDGEWAAAVVGFCKTKDLFEGRSGGFWLCLHRRRCSIGDGSSGAAAVLCRAISAAGGKRGKQEQGCEN